MHTGYYRQRLHCTLQSSANPVKSIMAAPHSDTQTDPSAVSAPSAGPSNVNFWPPGIQADEPTAISKGKLQELDYESDPDILYEIFPDKNGVVDWNQPPPAPVILYEIYPDKNGFVDWSTKPPAQEEAKRKQYALKFLKPPAESNTKTPPAKKLKTSAVTQLKPFEFKAPKPPPAKKLKPSAVTELKPFEFKAPKSPPAKKLKPSAVTELKPFEFKAPKPPPAKKLKPSAVTELKPFEFKAPKPPPAKKLKPSVVTELKPFEFKAPKSPPAKKLKPSAVTELKPFEFKAPKTPPAKKLKPSAVMELAPQPANKPKLPSAAPKQKSSVVTEPKPLAEIKTKELGEKLRQVRFPRRHIPRVDYQDEPFQKNDALLFKYDKKTRYRPLLNSCMSFMKYNSRMPYRNKKSPFKIEIKLAKQQVTTKKVLTFCAPTSGLCKLRSTQCIVNSALKQNKIDLPPPPMTAQVIVPKQQGPKVPDVAVVNVQNVSTSKGAIDQQDNNVNPIVMKKEFQVLSSKKSVRIMQYPRQEISQRVTRQSSRKRSAHLAASMNIAQLYCTSTVTKTNKIASVLKSKSLTKTITNKRGKENVQTRNHNETVLKFMPKQQKMSQKNAPNKLLSPTQRGQVNNQQTPKERNLAKKNITNSTKKNMKSKSDDQVQPVKTKGVWWKYYCPKCCDLVFHKPTELVQHYKIKHKGIDPFVCFLCQKAFKLSRGLKRHVVGKHSGRDNYEKCVEGLRSKKPQGDLRVMDCNSAATSSKSSSVSCSICHQVTTNLTKHETEMHNLLRKYQCNICKKMFNTPIQFNKHSTTMHNL